MSKHCANGEYTDKVMKILNFESKTVDQTVDSIKLLTCLLVLGPHAIFPGPSNLEFSIFIKDPQSNSF